MKVHFRLPSIGWQVNDDFSPEIVRAAREAVKVVLFVQGVMIFAAGAIPEPFRILALLPILSLFGVAFFAGAVALMRFVQRPARHESIEHVEAVPSFEPLPIRKIA